MNLHLTVDNIFFEDYSIMFYKNIQFSYFLKYFLPATFV